MTPLQPREQFGSTRLLVALVLASCFHAAVLFAWRPTFHEAPLADSILGNNGSEVELVEFAPVAESEAVAPVEEPIEYVVPEDPEEIEEAVEPEPPPLEDPAPEAPEPTPIPAVQETVPEPQPVVKATPAPAKKPKPVAKANPAVKTASWSVSSGASITQANAGHGKSGSSDKKPAYLRNPHPTYPEDARRAGAEGVVLLRVTVGKTGRIANVCLEKTCGNASLDRRALETVKSRWVFRPARLNGRTVEAEVLVPIRFSLR